MSLQFWHWYLHSPDPLRSPLRWFKWIRKVECFKCDLPLFELHDSYHIDRTPPVICNDIFNYPDVPFSPNSQDLENNFSGVVCPESVQVTFARDTFARLWKFNYEVVMINVVSSSLVVRWKKVRKWQGAKRGFWDKHRHKYRGNERWLRIFCTCDANRRIVLDSLLSRKP